jgi:hypothetical protein
MMASRLILSFHGVPGDQQCLYGFPDTHVVGHQQADGILPECHDEGDQLIGAGPEG